VVNDSAEVTSSGRSFHVRGPTTGKARLVGDGCQLNRRHRQTVGAELDMGRVHPRVGSGRVGSGPIAWVNVGHPG